MADSPVLYVYFRPDNDDAYPGVPGRHITEADWAVFSPSQRRTVEEATTQEGYTRRKVWVHRDLVDETEQERADREAAEQSARDAYERGQSIVRWRDFEPLVPGPGEVIVGSASGPVAVAGLSNPYEALDLWPEFDSAGGADSWNAETYAGYISGLDASLQSALSSGRVEKTTLGTLDGGTPMYCYEAGDGPVEVFMLAGQHGREVVGMYAAMRWFQQFVLSNDPTMRQLRDHLRVTYIPVMNAEYYRTGNQKPPGINLNRQWDFFWDMYAASSPAAPPGPSVFSEKETQLVRDKFLSRPYVIAMDFHNYFTSSPEEVKYLPVSDWLLGNRNFMVSVADDWARIYAGGDHSRINQMVTRGSDPMFQNWAMYIMRYQRGREDAIATTIEVPEDLHGGSFDHVTRAGMRSFCGYVTTLLQRWLRDGAGVIDRPYSFDIHAYKRQVGSSRLALPLAEGGGVIPTGGALAADPVRFDWTTPDLGGMGYGGAGLSRIGVVAPYARAHMMVSVMGEIQGTGTAGRVMLQLRTNGQLNARAASTIDVTATSDSRYPFMFRGEHVVTAVSNTEIEQFEVMAWMESGGPATLRRCSMHIEVSPDATATTPTPFVDQMRLPQ